MKYDPLVEPDSKRWLEADEMERLNLVLKYHRRTRVELPNEHLHTAIHLTVENQAALGRSHRQRQLPVPYPAGQVWQAHWRHESSLLLRQ